jgi:hypothetical protein
MALLRLPLGPAGSERVCAYEDDERELSMGDTIVSEVYAVAASDEDAEPWPEADDESARYGSSDSG